MGGRSRSKQSSRGVAGSRSGGATRRKGRSPARSEALVLSWVLPTKLAVGRLPRMGDGATLAQAGIRTVVAFCAETEGMWPEDVTDQFRCHRLVLPDSHYDREMEAGELTTAVELLHEQLQGHGPVYVHCLAGVERSPTVCVAYLCRYHRLEMWEALNWLKSIHPRTMLPESHLRALRVFTQGG